MTAWHAWKFSNNDYTYFANIHVVPEELAKTDALLISSLAVIASVSIAGYSRLEVMSVCAWERL